MSSKPPTKRSFNLPLRLSGTAVLAAVCGGLASAVMVAAAAKHLAFDVKLHFGPPMQAQQILPTVLGFLAPLPLMVATIGFGSVAGALAALCGAAAFGGVAPALVDVGEPYELSRAALRALGFALTFGGPALLLGSLARQPTSKQGTALAAEPRKDRLEERLIGRILSGAIGVSAGLMAVAAITLIEVRGGYPAFLQELTRQVQPVLAAYPNGKQVDPAWFARVLVWLGGFALALECVCLFALNLWLAGRIAQTSGLLTQPWPSLPRHLRVPKPLAILAAVAFGLSFAGGLVGLASAIVAGAIVAGFVFQGLAVVHELTRRTSWRTPILISMYIALSLLPALLVVFAAVGLCDAAFFFRDRARPAVGTKNQT